MNFSGPAAALPSGGDCSELIFKFIVVLAD
jgi:hypothetical protein